MKIIGIAATLPSRSVSNSDIIELVDFHSGTSFEGDLPKTLKVIGKLFEKSGIQSRYWLAPDEQPMVLLESTFERALSQANIKRDDIDLLIYTGVGRGFIEPANSYFVAKALGLSCRNFDVLDACMGWVSSMDIVNDKMKAGASRYAAIVNMEFNLVKGSHIFPKNFILNSASELVYKFPSFTVGEALTVTIVDNDISDNFRFSFISRPDLSDLCTISLPGWQSFCSASDIVSACGGKYQFNSHGSELHETAAKEAVNVFYQHRISKNDIQCVVTHTSSPKQWMHYGQMVGIAEKIHSSAEKTGNVVSASIPLGIVSAVQQGLLERDKICLGWVGSAGMVFSAITFRF